MRHTVLWTMFLFQALAIKETISRAVEVCVHFDFEEKVSQYCGSVYADATNITAASYFATMQVCLTESSPSQEHCCQDADCFQSKVLDVTNMIVRDRSSGTLDNTGSQTLPQNTSEQHHSWISEVCVDFYPGESTDQSGGGKAYHLGQNTGILFQRCALVYARAENITMASYVAVSSICLAAREVDCCRNAACFQSLVPIISSKIRWGKKLHDPAAVLLQQRAHGDTFVLAAEELLGQLGSLEILQVGANVGALENDPIYPLVKKYRNIFAVVIEPLTLQFAELCHNYRSEIRERRVEAIQTAICTYDGSSSFWSSAPPTQANGDFGHVVIGVGAQGPLFDFFYRGWHSQMGALGDNELEGRHEFGRAHPAVAAAVPQRTDVICQTVATMLKKVKLPFKRVDILVVDAEGSDLVVLESFFSARSNEGINGPALLTSSPRIVVFEHAMLDSSDRARAGRLLEQWGYVCHLYTGMDTLCLQSSGRAGKSPRHPEKGERLSAAAELLREECPGCCGSHSDDCPALLKSAEPPRFEFTAMLGSRDVALDIVGDMHPTNSAWLACLAHSFDFDTCKRLVDVLSQMWLDYWRSVSQPRG